MADWTENEQIEQRALTISKWASLFSAVIAIAAAFASNAQAVLLDGLFSLIDFVAAVIGARVSIDALRAPDRRRPFGYAAQESAFTTFRSLSLLAVVVYAMFGAVQEILAYIRDGEAEELNFQVIFVYLVVIIALCFWLHRVQLKAWVQSGRKSGILKLEADEALLSGLMSVGYGLALLLLPFLEGTPLAFLVPVGDSLIVLMLCLFVTGRYWMDFRRGLGELIGTAARPREIRAASQAVHRALDPCGGKIIDVALVRVGRRFDAVVFYDPRRAIEATEVDDLTLRVEAEIEAALGSVEVFIVVSEYGRAWPEGPAA